MTVSKLSVGRGDQRSGTPRHLSKSRITCMAGPMEQGSLGGPTTGRARLRSAEERVRVWPLLLRVTHTHPSPSLPSACTLRNRHAQSKDSRMCFSSERACRATEETSPSHRSAAGKALPPAHMSNDRANAYNETAMPWTDGLFEQHPLSRSRQCSS